MLYLVFLALLTIPSVQARFFYLQKVQNHIKDLNTPEHFGFLHKQATPFYITTPDKMRLHAWHILPLTIYRRNSEKLTRQDPPSNTSGDFIQTLNFRLLRDDPQARLIIVMHGIGGNLASGGRPISYRLLYSAAPDHIHILAFDYRGFGLSRGKPSEQGLVTDANAAFWWATQVASVPPERIILFGHSLGSAVAIALTNQLAKQNISCAGLIIAGAFSDIPTLMKTYRFLGLPIFLPLVKVKPLYSCLQQYLYNKWLSKDRIAELVRKAHRHHITLIHTEDDPVIPISHCDSLFRHAVHAISSDQIPDREFEEKKASLMVKLGESGWMVEWPSGKGLIRQDVACSGGHNMVLFFSVIQAAILRAFHDIDPEQQW